LKGKIIVDVTNIMYLFDSSNRGQISSTLLNQKALGVPAHWTTAFKSTNNVCLYLLAFHMVFELEETVMIHPLSPLILARFQ
jgi:hypothetical protein